MLTTVDSFWRRIKLIAAALPSRGEKAYGPAFLYHDFVFGDVEQAALLIEGKCLFDRTTYTFDVERPDTRKHAFLAWPEEARRWFYSFSWLGDLQALGTNEARLTARKLILAWVSTPPADHLAQEPGIIGQRLAHWLGHYDFCMATAPEQSQKSVMDNIGREGRVLAALLPIAPCGWPGLAALRGLLAAFMALPVHEGFYLRFGRYLPAELERVILADGTAVERSPEAQFQIVRELLSIASMLTVIQVEIPVLLQTAIRKTCAVLKALCHGDGGLALFNGTSEGNPDFVMTLLDSTEHYRTTTSVLPQGGFVRLRLGQALLLVDAAAPPEYDFDGNSHAGTLSFEFSYHKHRLLVNSGAARTGIWKAVLRESVAHNVAVLGGVSSSEFGPDGHIICRPEHVICAHHTTPGAHWLDLSHDGYHPHFGAVWQRNLYLGSDGDDLRGQENFEADLEIPCVLRFYVHPDVRVTLEEEDVILSAGETFWRFRQTGGALEVAESLYLGRNRVEKNWQIVISAVTSVETSLLGTGPVGFNAGEAGCQRYKASVSWIMERVPA